MGGCQAGSRSPTEREAELLKGLAQRDCVALAYRGNLMDLLAERATFTRCIGTKEAPPRQMEGDCPTRAGKVCERARKATMHTPRPMLADWAASADGAGGYRQDHPMRRDRDSIQMDRMEMRKQSLVQLCKRLAHGELRLGERGITDYHVQSRYIPLRRRERFTANVPEPAFNEEVEGVS